jgi:hypothetical protein
MTGLTKVYKEEIAVFKEEIEALKKLLSAS